MAASISKDQIIEFISKRRDVLVLLLLLILGAWGYLRLREPLAKTVDESIEEHVRGGGSGSAGGADALNSTELLGVLESKRPLSIYRVSRNPFGTPAEQLRLRQEVQQLYQRGVDLYKTGKWELAIPYFNRVIRLDVTETRIQYPISPSEYIRLADRQVKIRNLDPILAKANLDIQRAGGLESSSVSEAIDAYESALLALRNLLSVDPQGEAMGKEKFDEISGRVSQLVQTVNNLKRQTLGQDVEAAISALNSAMQQASSNAYGVLLAVTHGRVVRKEVQEVDAGGSVIPAAKRTQLDSLVQTAEQTLAGALDDVAQQVQTRVSDSVQQGEFAAAHEGVNAFCDLCDRYPENSVLLAAQIDVMATYLVGVIQAGRDELKRITVTFQKGDYAGYDPKAKEVLLGHLSTALSLGSLLTDNDRVQLAQLADSLRRIKPPPPLDTVYDLLSCRSIGTRYRIKLREKSTKKEISLLLRKNRKDRAGFLLRQVDSRNRVVILSKLPEYAPSQFKLP